MSLDHVDEISLEPRLLFTEPWDPIVDWDDRAQFSKISDFGGITCA